MIFNKVINEITIDAGQVGSHFVQKVEPEPIIPKVKKKKKNKVFGSWFTKHDNLAHLNKGK